MARDEDTTAKPVKGKPVSAAMAAWAEALDRATTRKFVARGESVEHERIAVDLGAWLAKVFAGGREVQPEEIEILERMWAAHQPATPATRIAAAVDLIEQHAGWYRLAPEARSDEYQGNTRTEIARMLAVDLWASVDSAFDPLD
ncbi:MAG TPA: hypothetical protein VF989_14370, partial [Polyangiaceae bacterium]